MRDGPAAARAWLGVTVLVVVVVALVIGRGREARADAAPLRVAFVASGRASADVTKALRASVPPGVVAVDPPDLATTVRAAVGAKPLHVPLDAGDTEALRHAASALRVDAFVVFKVKGTAKTREVLGEVFDVTQAGAFAEHLVRLGVRPQASDATALGEITQALARVRPAQAGSPTVVAATPAPTPAAAAPSPAAPSPGAPTPAGPQGATTPATDPLAAVGDLARALASVSAAVDVGTRGFTYHDGLSANLRPYSGALAPAFSVHGEVYPLAASSQGFGRNIGLVADYRAAVDLSSRPASGSTVETSWVGYDVLLRVRIPFGTNAPRVLGVFAGYAREEFVFAIPVKSYPSAAYPSVRAGVDVRVPFGQSAITLAGDYDAVLSVEYVGTNFRAPAVGGVDASVTYGYRIASVLEVFAQGSMSRYFYSFGPKPGDAWVAGGAVDQMFHGQLGVRATY